MNGVFCRSGTANSEKEEEEEEEEERMGEMGGSIEFAGAQKNIIALPTAFYLA